MNDSRIKWQCRRGTRELDELLVGWFDRSYATASELQKSAFLALLELQDPDLIDYLLGHVRPEDSQTAAIVDAIRRRPAAG